MAAVEEGLDDLRKKRLAYFGTFGKTDLLNNHSATLNNNVANCPKEPENCSEKQFDKNYNLVDNQEYEAGLLPANFRRDETQFNNGETSHHDQHFALSEKMAQNGTEKDSETKMEYKHGDLNGLNMTTFSEHGTTPAVTIQKSSVKVNRDFNLEYGSHSDLPAELKHTVQGMSQKSNDLDAYNETVERLIQATKEELLGLKSNDDIWKKFKKDGFQDQHLSEEASFVKNKLINDDHERVKLGDTTHSQSSGKNSKADSYDHPELLMNEKENKTTKISHTSFEKPEISKYEPQLFSGSQTQSQVQKSLTSTKVEEIFNSRMFPRQPEHAHDIQESREFETVKETVGVQQSSDMTELGLATHRPDSDRQEGLEVEAEDLNLGDTVTKELRTVLGEEKFREFLAKAKRDIDDLHERSSENSNSARRDKTPRLIKDKTLVRSMPPSQHSNSNDSKSRRPRKHDVITTPKKEVQQFTTEPEEAVQVNCSANFIPRLSDGDAIENMIEEYVLNKSEDKRKQSDSKVLSKSSGENVDAGVTENEKLVPTLDLNDVNKQTSPRPKLNRPKHEPPTIYQDNKTNSVKEVQERKGSGDVRLRQSNYEQVTVPRNVAFSADEIYNQAYGLMYPGQSAAMKQHYLHGNPVLQGDFGPMQYVPYNVPQTPTTPESQPVFQAFLQGRHEPEVCRPAINYEMIAQYRGIPARQLSFQGEGTPVPHPPVESSNMSYDLPHTRHQGMHQTMHIPHPPTTPTSVPVSPEYFYPSHSTSDSRGQTTLPACIAHPKPIESVPHPAVASASLNLKYTTPLPATVSAGTARIPVSVTTQTANEDQTSPPPQTPTTSNAEVQTDREDYNVHETTDKVTMVEESTFTSVSQIEDNEKFVPHPPPVEKDSARPSPHRHHRADISTRKAMNTKQHIDGIRQHHEQRRQQYEEDKLTEDQVVERQKRFAKASLERYFTSLEDVYKPSAVNKPSDILPEDFHEDAPMNAESSLEEPFLKSAAPADELELESLTSDRNNVGNSIAEPRNSFYKKRDPESFVADVTSTVLEDNEPKPLRTETDALGVSEAKIPVAYGFIDFSGVTVDQNAASPVLTSKHEENENKTLGIEVKADSDKETLVESTANTDFTLKAGGLTDRLNDLGINVSQIKGDKDLTGTASKNEKKGVDKKKGAKKGKVLIVCPECKGLNKEYMSWCTQCGEMIIGVEPMLVSKNKEGKIRTQPIEKPEKIEDKPEVNSADKVERFSKLSTESHSNNEISVNYEQDMIEKPFTLNLDAIKAEREEEELLNLKKSSPNKSDGKDSGRPSSGDADLDIRGTQTQKIEEEVVNDICASISDPVVKGIVKSHFSRSKQSHQELSSDFSSPEYLFGLGKECERNFGHENECMRSSDDRSHVGHEISGSRFEKEEHHKKLLEDSAAKNSELRTVKNTFDSMQEKEVNGRNIAEMGNKKPKSPALRRVNKHTNDSVDLKGPSSPSLRKQNKSGTSNIKNYDVVKTKVKRSSDKMDISDSDPAVLEEEQLIPPPVPSFSEALPVSHNELALKLPANSMDYSVDMSQVVSQNFDSSDVVKHEPGDSKMSKEQRKKERRRKKGHGAIDVEVFGYEESRESRNSSRANRMVPLLNLAGNSSDDDDSVMSDFKPAVKQEVKQKPLPQSSLATSMNAWGTPVSDGQGHSLSWKQPPLEEEFQSPSISPSKNESLPKDRPVLEQQQHIVGPDLEQPPVEPDVSVEMDARYVMTANLAQPRDATQTGETTQSSAAGMNADAEEWRELFEPQSAEQDNLDEAVDDIPAQTEDDNQPFLFRVMSHLKPNKSKTRPKSAGASKPVKSKVRQSIEEGGYKRKWERSSIAWSSYNARELNTSSSLRSSSDLTRKRPASAPKSRTPTLHGMQASNNLDEQASDDRESSRQETNQRLPQHNADVSKRNRPASAPKSRTQTSADMQVSSYPDEQACVDQDFRDGSPTREDIRKNIRPFSADVSKRSTQKKKSKKKMTGGFDLELDFLEDMIEHRLPKPSMLDRLHAKAEKPVASQEASENMASPKSTYDKYIEMTPRIEDGTVSRWQCLPDEILIHIFAYLDQSSLNKAALVCKQFYRVAMDESLWKYITIKKTDLDDSHLEEIAQRHPVSLALIQCYGDRVTARGLRDLFKECADTLKELNVARCSRGALCGDSVLLHAAARCRSITHLDVSWCNVTDSGLMAISNCCQRLESLCINGCNAVSNDGLETLIKKHGTQLRVLEMFGCFNLSPRGLRSIANSCVNLISLNLGQCYKITDSCISQLSTTLGRVETLDLRGCKQVKDNCIRRVVKNCTRLKNLSLANCPNITDVSVLEISTYLTDIRSLDVCGCKNITDSSIRALVNTCTNLRHIDISSTGCTHRSVSMIGNFCAQRLESLKINFLSDVTEQSLIKLARHCHRLKSVHMYGCTGVRNLDKVKDERPSFAIEM